MANKTFRIFVYIVPCVILLFLSVGYAIPEQTCITPKRAATCHVRDGDDPKNFCPCICKMRQKNWDQSYAPSMDCGSQKACGCQ